MSGLRYGSLLFDSSPCILIHVIAMQALQVNASSTSNFNVTFGEALAFYYVKTTASSHAMVVYWPLENLESSLNVPRGIWNRQTPKVENVVNILNIVGIWTASESSKCSYVLRKHPGLAMLSMEEAGIVTPDEE